MRVFGHPAHTALVHFPIGLLGVVPLWDSLALWRGPDPWGALGFWTLVLGLVSAAPAVGTGLLDYAGLREGHPAEDRAARHMWAVLAALALYGASLGLRWPGGGAIGSPGWAAWGSGVAGLLLLGIAGWLGGDLVLRHGVGAAEP